jgi:hypothetical protein
MIAIAANWRDVQKYYEQSYIKIQGYGDKLFFVNRVRENIMTGWDEEETQFELFLSNSDPFVIDYVLPHRAVFQYGSDAYLLRRFPSRQYRRGLHCDNTSITSVSSGVHMDMGFAVLKAFVEKQKYLTLTAAIAAKGRYTAVALSSRMSYIRAGGELRIDTTTVASVNVTERSIKMRRPIFLKEILQYLKDYNEPFTVIA